MDDALSQRHGIRPEAPLGKHDPAITDQHHAAATRPIARITHERRRQHPFQLEPDAGVRARSEEHTSELQSLMRISYAVFCLKKKKKTTTTHDTNHDTNIPRHTNAVQHNKINHQNQQTTK